MIVMVMSMIIPKVPYYYTCHDDNGDGNENDHDNIGHDENNDVENSYDLIIGLL